MGLAGFGIGLVALAFLPYVMSPVTAVVLITVYSLIFALVIAITLRRDIDVAGVRDLLIGTVIGTPLGVWVLATFPAHVLNRLIGLVLILAVVLEIRGALPETLTGQRWGLVAGFLGGAIGGAVGTPGPPVVLYSTTQGWSPRTARANLQAFFIVNEVAVLVGYWWAGLLTQEVGRFAVGFALPALAGVAAGLALGNRVDRLRFRRIVFGLLFVSGALLIVRG